jgi:hypothetical protein
MRLLVVRQGAAAVMDAIPRSPFETLEICFRLLSTGPEGLALDGRRLGHGLPARRISLVELRVLLQHPAATGDLQRAVVEELIHKARQQDEEWMVGVAGVLLPGLRRIAATIAVVDGQASHHVEADLLELVHDAIGQRAPEAGQLALGVLEAILSGHPSFTSPMERGDPLGP